MIGGRRVWEGLFTTGLGAGILALIPSQVGEIPGMETNMSPSFIPLVVGIALAVVGIAMAAIAVLSKERKDSKKFDKGGFPRVLLSALLLVAYAVLFPIVGFVTASAFFIGVFSFLYGQRSPGKLAAVVVIVPVIVWILFEIIFVIPLPHGLIF